jgi:hypothetical protein
LTIHSPIKLAGLRACIFLSPHSRDCGAKPAVVSVRRVPDQGVKRVIAFSGMAQIGLKLAGGRMRRPKGQGPKILCRLCSPSPMPKAISTHCGKTRLSGWASAILVSEVPISKPRFTVRIALIKLEKRPPFLQVTIGYSHFVSVLAVIDQGTIPGLLARPMAVRPRLETRSPQYFPRRCAAPRDRFASKYLDERVLHVVPVLRIQAAGGGHLRSRIAGEWSPDEDLNGDLK